MAKKGQHKNDARDQRKSPGPNNPSKSVTITTGTYKKKETAEAQRGPTRTPTPAQAAQREWNPDSREGPGAGHAPARKGDLAERDEDWDNFPGGSRGRRRRPPRPGVPRRPEGLCSPAHSTPRSGARTSTLTPSTARTGDRRRTRRRRAAHPVRAEGAAPPLQRALGRRPQAGAGTGAGDAPAAGGHLPRPERPPAGRVHRHRGHGCRRGEQHVLRARSTTTSGIASPGWRSRSASPGARPAPSRQWGQVLAGASVPGQGRRKSLLSSRSQSTLLATRAQKAQSAGLKLTTWKARCRKGRERASRCSSRERPTKA